MARTTPLRPPRAGGKRTLPWSTSFAESVGAIAGCVGEGSVAEACRRADALSRDVRCSDVFAYPTARAAKLGRGSLLQLWASLLDLCAVAPVASRKAMYEDVAVIANRSEFDLDAAADAARDGLAAAYCAALVRTTELALRVLAPGSARRSAADRQAELAFAARVLAVAYIRRPALSGAILHAVLEGAEAAGAAASGEGESKRGGDEPPGAAGPGGVAAAIARDMEEDEAGRDASGDRHFCAENPSLFGWSSVASESGAGLLEPGGAWERARPHLATPAFFCDFFRALVTHVEVVSLNDVRGFWSLVPGYRALAAALLPLVLVPVQASPAPGARVLRRSVAACALRVGRSDPALLVPLTRATLRATRVTDRDCVETALAAVVRFCSAVDPGEAESSAAACVGARRHPRVALPPGHSVRAALSDAQAARLVPELAEAFLTLVRTDHFHLVLRALVFVYDVMPRLGGRHRVAFASATFLAPSTFATLFAHWSAEVRLLFAQVVVFRLRRGGTTAAAAAAGGLRSCVWPVLNLRAAGRASAKRPGWILRHLASAAHALRSRFARAHRHAPDKSPASGSADDDAEHQEILEACDEYVATPLDKEELAADQELASCLERALELASAPGAAACPAYLKAARETLENSRATYARLQEHASAGGVVSPRLHFTIPRGVDAPSSARNPAREARQEPMPHVSVCP